MDNGEIAIGSARRAHSGILGKSAASITDFQPVLADEFAARSQLGDHEFDVV